MKPTHMLAALVLAVLSLASLSTAWAGDDHDEAPVAATGPALPRFTAVSELFELVGVVNGKQITLYLDHFADGSPVKDAKLALELGGIKVPVESHAEGEFEATLAQPLASGEFPVTATVYSGEKTDLLAGDLDIHAEAESNKVAGAHGRQEVALWAALAIAVLAGLAWLIRRLRAQRLGGTA